MVEVMEGVVRVEKRRDDGLCFGVGRLKRGKRMRGLSDEVENGEAVGVGCCCGSEGGEGVVFVVCMVVVVVGGGGAVAVCGVVAVVVVVVVVLVLWCVAVARRKLFSFVSFRACLGYVLSERVSVSCLNCLL